MKKTCFFQKSTDLLKKSDLKPLLPVFFRGCVLN